MSLTVVVAPDSFKGSLPARAVAEAIADGWRSVRPRDTLELLPQADGGEGTLDAIEAAVPGSVRRSAGDVTGPDGNPVPGEWLELPGRIAVVELAQCSGLPLMGELSPLTATTRGMGEVIRAAIDAGADSLVIALGGSASTDGGAGALGALGLRLADAAGNVLPAGGAALAQLHAADPSALVSPPPGGVTMLTDVDSPLLGERGAAAVFGPQKGASEAQVDELDVALARFAEVLGGDPGLAGAGAAGGTGYGFSAAWSAVLASGSKRIAELTGLDDAIARADVVLTGEGRFDDQSLSGKVVGNALELAAVGAATVGVIAGQLRDEPPCWGVSLTQLAGSAEASMAETARWLREAGAVAARELGERR